MGRSLALVVGGLVTLEAGGIVGTGSFPALTATSVSTFRETSPSSAVHVTRARLKQKRAKRQYQLEGGDLFAESEALCAHGTRFVEASVRRTLGGYL